MAQPPSSSVENTFPLYDYRDAEHDPVVGIIGGMGPDAGWDLARKITDHTVARGDHEHVAVAVLSYPGRIPDRSTFLFDERRPTPVPAIARIAGQLEDVGAVAAGIPCNTAHDPRVWGAVEGQLRAEGREVRLIHMIRETARFIRRELPEVEAVGILSSSAVWRFGLYANALQAEGLRPVKPPSAMQQDVVNPVIFDRTFGIKAQAHPVHEQARANLMEAMSHLREEGAEAIVLGCTEFPLALPEPTWENLPLIDPTTVLARALIEAVAPQRLKPWAVARQAA